jgi:phage/plasmid-associated DNA primase
METYGERHPEEQARLVDMRLAIASEIPEGRRWNDQRLKLLSGREIIPARDMYGKTFNFWPTHKLLLYGNHLPGFRAVNPAIRGRMRIIPHPILIRGTALEVKGLEDLLVDEYPAILRWFIDGAVSWLKRGKLLIPPSIIRATENYLNSEDEIGSWLAASAAKWPAEAKDVPLNAERQPQNRKPLADFVRAFNNWREINAGGSKIKHMTANAFGHKLRDIGVKVEHFREGSYVWGWRLREQSSE